MAVHPAPVDPRDRLRHESRIQPVREGDRLGDLFEGDNVVGRPQGIGIVEVDLVLGGRDFVMSGFHLEAHLGEGADDLRSGSLSPVDGKEVEVAPLVLGSDSRLPVVVQMQ